MRGDLQNILSFEPLYVIFIFKLVCDSFTVSALCCVNDLIFTIDLGRLYDHL